MGNRQQANTLCQQAHLRVVESYRSEGDPLQLAESVDLYMAAIDVDPKFDEPYLGLAYLSFIGGDQEQALQLLHQAEKLNPINMRTASLRQKILRTPYTPSVKLEKIEGTLSPTTEQSLDVAILVDSDHLARSEAEVPPQEPETPPPGLQIHPDLGPPNRPGKISTGADVQLLQRLLQRLGFKVSLSGEYDGPTLNAVKNFQYRKQISVTGLPDPKTRAFLNHMLSKLPPDELMQETEEVVESDDRLWEEAEMPTCFSADLGPPERVDKISSGPEILLLQELLIQLQYPLEVSGIYDKLTFAAIRSFQANQKLPVSGMVDQKTRNALNHLLEQTFVENIVRVEFMKQIWQFRNQRGQSVTPLLGLQLNKWLQQMMLIAKQAPNTDDNPYQLAASPERIYIESVLGPPGQMNVVSQGLEVLRLQEVLAEEGFAVECNAQFDMNTFSALREYQQAHQIPIAETVTGETRQQLNQSLQIRYTQETALESLWASLARLQAAWEVSLSEKAYQEIAPLLLKLLTAEDIEPFAAELGPSNRPGKIYQGHEVALLKWLIEQDGYSLSNPAPIFDTELYNELRKFQQKHQLPMTGLVDEKTRTVLNEILQKLSPS